MSFGDIAFTRFNTSIGEANGQPGTYRSLVIKPDCAGITPVQSAIILFVDKREGTDLGFFDAQSGLLVVVALNRDFDSMNHLLLDRKSSHLWWEADTGTGRVLWYQLTDVGLNEQPIIAQAQAMFDNHKLPPLIKVP